MKLYHPSDTKFNIVKTKYFGENYYTIVDVKASNIKRTFWYLTSDIPEKRFRDSKYLYIIDIASNKIYDLKKDKKHLIRKFDNIHRLLIYLSKRYEGVIYNVGYDIVAIFKDKKPIKIIERK